MVVIVLAVVGASARLRLGYTFYRSFVYLYFPLGGRVSVIVIHGNLD
jgi:hypothetical protein